MGSASSGDTLALVYIPADDRIMALADAVKLLGVDFVVDKSLTNSADTWSYIKWASGRVEAWGKFSKSGMALTSASGGTYYNSSGYDARTLPAGLKYSQVMSATASLTGTVSTGVFVYTVSGTGTDLWTYFRAHTSTASASVNYYVRVEGDLTLT